MSDTAIFSGIIIIFIITGAVLPFIQKDFSTPFTENNYSVTGTLPADDTNPVTSTFSWFGVFFSIAKMFVWSFGALPIWLELIFEIMRIILYLIGFRMIRGIS
jgi:hypothetical protein